MKVEQYGATDIGNIRKTNQDGWLMKHTTTGHNQLIMGVICDGMGGTKRGDIARDLTLEQFGFWWDALMANKDKISEDSFDGIGRSAEVLLEKINDKICDYIESSGQTTGTTLSMMFAINKKFFIKHIGDSRIYSLQQNQLMQLTEDQAVERMNPKTGRVKRYLVNCLGFRKYSGPESIEGELTGDAVFILTTDGLHEFIDEDLLEELVLPLEKKFSKGKKVVEQLFAEVKSGQAPDNMTILAFRIGGV